MDHLLKKSFAAAPAASLLLALLLGACQHDEPDFYTGTVAADYRDRHPIRLVDGQRSIQVLVGSGRAGLTATQRAQVASLGSDWRQEGTGYVIVEAPSGAFNSVAAKQTLHEIKSLLQFAGVPPRAIVARRYESPYRGDLGAIRVTYSKIQAVAGPCAQWPDNIGPGLVGNERYPLQESENVPFWNFGCATQKNLAAAVANPEDLVQPRPETPAYAPRRQTVVDKYRQGQDPSTVYTQNTGGKVSNVGP
ncbi:MAG TPA: CpaD family pilus assembly protein [Xanthobacteraceae bacterium]|nr:CpaD family pilus assembly protein [Xanthobacteraceae bacterium]